MDIPAEELVRNHRQPITKLNTQGPKLSISTGSEEEKGRVESALGALKAALSAERVERRCGRSQCVWLQNEHLGQITKIVGKLLQNYGFQNKNGTFLRPEEVLFLLEMNKIELLWNEVPMSIQQAYTMILKDVDALNKYRAYKSLKLIGYKLEKNERRLKRQLEEKMERQSKKSCLEEGASSSEIFENTLKQVQNTETALWDYKVRFPESSKKDDTAFYLFVNKTETIDQCLRFTEADGPVVTAITSKDDVAFYRFACIDLPVL